MTVKRVKSEEYGYAGYWICDDGKVIHRLEGTEVPVYSNGMARLLRNSTRKKVNVSVHRLVAYVFLENPKGYSFVRFIDGNSTNRAKDNLEWVLSVKKVSATSKEIVQAKQMGMSTVEIAHQFDRTPQYINRVLKDHKKRLEE